MMTIEIDGHIYTAKLDDLYGIVLRDEWGKPAGPEVYAQVDEWALVQELSE